LPLILIVDDDLITTQVLTGLLRGAGFATVSAHTLTDAAALVRSQTISLILLDVHLPDGNGLDFCEQLTPTIAIPILFISANDDVTTKVRGFAAGGVDYIPKPLAGTEVLARVRTHLRLRAAYDSLADLQAERIQRLAVSQQALMPLAEELPEARFNVCLRQALQAGGDFYDVIPSGNRITDYVIADASGHDLGVSLWTASFKTLLAEYATILHSPLEICQIINRSLRRILPQGAYFTTIYARLNRSSNKLTLINAGHPSAILVAANTGSANILQQEGDLIGIFPDAVFGILEVPVQPGDRLFLYSDGLVEQAGSRQKGTAHLMEACQISVNLSLKNAVASVAASLCDNHELEDDIVLMGVEV
ncbi:MAG: SpoIIE family protein phosphatase, partial [Desulfofustis sp.]|jgi:sigma-B regulation protein RsbU (phosphoserine phosphatase)|nr:SpoIIE family protein phosphatase [Desulfofustis sp.]